VTVAIGEFAKLLKSKRGQRGVRAAALDANVSASTFSRVENGHLPDLETFAKLCRWINRDPKDFLGLAETGAQPQRRAAVGHFKKKKTVSLETAEALGKLILAAQEALRARENLIDR
jgi:transcriptional regulator with XRE-family HTH domain